MRVRARLTAALTGIALTASLAGCVTVRGEEALLPTTTEDEAADVLANYAEVKNEGNPAYDAELNSTVDTGTLLNINSAGHTARHRVHPEGNPNYQPMEFSDSVFHIPRQAGWPKHFVADTATNRGDARWLLVFTRDAVDQDWRANYLVTLPPEDVPVFTEDEEGHAEFLTADETEGLAMSPASVAEGYAEYLQSGEGPYTDGPLTTGERERREEAGNEAAYVVQYQDQAAAGESSPPLALRTEDGALVFFSTQHHEKQTWAEGETPVIDQYVEALLEGEATRSVTTRRMSMQVSMVPESDVGEIEVASRVFGVVGAGAD
ncbi:MULTISPECIES: hypothetical protein [unclassified Streptomyces]|uniref:hypothetical protein n=1 Tax=unclassified Streptomyces TaxID=2593676 RepID=UPI000CD4F4D8|nr:MULTISPECIES: hypothetical protein [unclassified Streptomyces]